MCGDVHLTSSSGARTRGPDPIVTAAGSGALLLDAAVGVFSDETQRRIWAVGRALWAMPGVHEVVPGMNNILVAFDVFAVAPSRMAAELWRLWREVVPAEFAGKLVDVPVTYGGDDLAPWAAHCGLSVDHAVRRHAGGTYSVAAIGAMPGFPYLSGLDPTLSCPRRATPRMGVPEGAVMIGGAQAGIMPVTAPSGWHILGRCRITLFDPKATPPVLLQPGDTVRFSIAGIEA